MDKTIPKGVKNLEGKRFGKLKVLSFSGMDEKARIYNYCENKNLFAEDKWDARFLKLAEFVSCWSKDPSTKTGAVIVDEKRRVVSLGYNGFARGIEDSPEKLWDRETKYKMIIHCERNALLFASKSVEGCTLYTWPFMSCASCASMVIQSGIKRCVAPISTNERWEGEFQIAKKLFSEAGIILDFSQVVK